MALAPKVTSTANDKISGSERDSSTGKLGKARQRGRNADSTTKKLTQNSGSSGKALSVSKMPKLDWAEIEPYLAHLTDIACKINHVQAGSGWATISVSIPLEYLPDAMEAHLASRQGMVFMKMYYVPTEIFQEAQEARDGAEQSA